MTPAVAESEEAGDLLMIAIFMLAYTLLHQSFHTMNLPRSTRSAAIILSALTLTAWIGGVWFPSAQMGMGLDPLAPVMMATGLSLIFGFLADFGHLWVMRGGLFILGTLLVWIYCRSVRPAGPSS
jgi:hypothetical protein